jgi:flagellar basal body-associated protein FliL
MEKGRLMMIIIIVLLVVLLGTVAAVSIYVLNLINTNNEAIADGSAAITEQKKIPIENMVEVPLGDSFTTNLQPSADGSEHNVRIRVNLRYDKTDEEAATAFGDLLAANMNMARYIALNCIADRTKEDINDSDRLAMLGDEIKEKLQIEFNTSLIQDVYFDDKIVP